MEPSVNASRFKQRLLGLGQIFLRFSPVFIFTSCYLIWNYLNELGWLSLFSTSLQINTDLIVTLVCFFIFSMAFFTIIFLPSLFICQLPITTSRAALKNGLRAKYIPHSAYAVSLSAIAFISLIAQVNSIPDAIKNHSVIILFLLLFLLSSILVQCITEKRTRHQQQGIYPQGKWQRWFYFNKLRIMTIFVVAMTGAMVVFPLQLAFSLGSAYSSNGLRNALAVFALISLLSFTPAIVFYSVYIRSSDISTPLRASLYCAAFTFIIAFFLLPNLVSILSYKAFKKAGIIDESQHVYMISKKQYSPDMFPSPVWKQVSSSGNAFYLKGISLFSLGESTLLCPSFVVKTKEKYLKFNFDNIFGNNDLALKHLRNLARSCVPVRKTEMARWDAIEDKGNKINSGEFQVGKEMDNN